MVANVRRVVITHPEWGIYLGSCFGLGFWSKLDCAGQSEACTFADEADAEDYVKTWDENNDPSDYTFVAIVCGTFATIAQLKGIGLDTTEMERELLLYGSDDAVTA